MTKISDTEQRKIVDKVNIMLGRPQDALTVVLRGHLASENLLENIIEAKLPRGDKVIEKGSLSYSQKLTLVEALECAPDNVISSLRNLNKLRNKFSHTLDAIVSESEITRIGSPIGEPFTKAKRDYGGSSIETLRMVIGYNMGYLAAECHKLET